MNANNPIIVVGDGVASPPDIDRSDTDILLVAAERIHHRMEADESEANGGFGRCDDELGFGNSYCCCAITAQFSNSANPRSDYIRNRLFELFSEHFGAVFIWAVEGDSEARILGLLLLREIMLDEEAEREAARES